MAESIVTQVKRIGEGLYQVASETVPGRSYTIDLKDGASCQCPHHVHRVQGKSADACKHVKAARARVAAVAAQKAIDIPDVVIDQLACKYEEQGRLEISRVLYAEIRRRTAPAPFIATLSEEARKAIFR